MRILFLESSFIWIYSLPYGFVENGHQVMISGPLTEKNIPHMIKEFEPDLIFTIGWGVENTEIKQKWIYTAVHEAKIPLIYWAIEDAAFIDKWSLKIIRNIKPDFTFTIAEESLEVYKNKGIRAGYMDFGYHPKTYYPTKEHLDYKVSIAVVANAYPNVLDEFTDHYRRISIENLIVPLLKENIRIDFWGRDWDKVGKYLGMEIPPEWLHGYIPYKDANYVYNSADIIIGLQNYPTQVTQRTYEILGAGGFLLTQHTPQVIRLFESGKEVVTSSTPEETVERVRYYLNHPEEREEICEQGRLAVQKHSYNERAREMLKILLKEGIIQSDIDAELGKGEIYYYENYSEDKFHLYIVSPGDTLYRISQKFKVPLNKIIELNNLISDEIIVDQVLKISEKVDEEVVSQYTGGNPEAAQWLKYIKESAEKYQIPDSILYGIMITESHGNPNLVSKTGGIGLMQLQVETANWLGVNPCDPIQSIEGAACYLNKLYDQFKDWKLAVVAYNIGPDKVKEYNGIPPLDGPQRYLKNVFSISGGMR